MTQDALYVHIALWSQVASAILFVVALVYIFVRYLQPMVLAAQERSNQQIAEAERHRDDAKAALELLRGEIENATQDAQRIRDRAARHGELERDATLADVKSAGERSLRNAEGELDRARDAARVRLRFDLVRKALAAARDAAQQRVDGTRNAGLVNEFLSTLENAPR